MSTRSDDFFVDTGEARGEQSTGCEITSSDTRGGGGGSKERVYDIRSGISISNTGSIEKDRMDIDTRGGGKGTKD